MPNLETLLSMEDEVNAVLNDLGIPEKLSEMDDFMNQNDLKVNITNENAVVTGLVTYTCTVKDKDNNALANKVVEWYKGTTLLGMDATDSNGISTFSHRVTEADIYDVHAVVRGTHAGDDIRMFVKDNKNILTHNQWTAGEYLNNTTGFTIRNVSAEQDSSQSILGNTSLKLTPTDNNSRITLIEDGLTNAENAIAKFKIHNPSGTAQVYFSQKQTGSEDVRIDSVTISPNNSFEQISMSGNLLENLERLTVVINMTGVIYLDDFQLILF